MTSEARRRQAVEVAAEVEVEVEAAVRFARPLGGGRYVHVGVALGAGGRYEAADSLLVRSPNSEAAVGRVAACLDLAAEGAGGVQHSQREARLQALRWEVELHGSGGRAPRALLEAMLEALLARCGGSAAEGEAREQMESLKRMLVADAYQSEYAAARRQAASTARAGDGSSGSEDAATACAPSGVADVLEAHSLARLSPARLLAALSPRERRAYTICSTSAAGCDDARVAEVIFRVAGSCTDWLAARRPGDPLRVAVRPSAFRLPPAAGPGMQPPPLLMIAAGAGVAPFRALIREAVLRARASRPHMPRIVLLVGARDAAQSLPFGDELRAVAGDCGSVDLTLMVAESRPAAGDGRYVQDLLAADEGGAGALVAALLKAPGSVCYVCGGTAMGHAVEKALTRLAGDPSYGGDWLAGMRAERRYVAELWG